jgi:hypothetical protein
MKVLRRRQTEVVGEQKQRQPKKSETMKKIQWEAEEAERDRRSIVHASAFKLHL